MKPHGILSISKIVTAEGHLVGFDDAIRYGWLRPPPEARLVNGELQIGRNLFLDNGRQCLAYAFGQRSPVGNYVCERFGLGTGTTPPNVADVMLEAPITFFEGGITKPVNEVDWPAPFVARVEFTVAATEANGYLITEMGLFTGNDTLMARRVHVGINKTSDFAPTLAWRVRM